MNMEVHNLHRRNFNIVGFGALAVVFIILVAIIISVIFEPIVVFSGVEIYEGYRISEPFDLGEIEKVAESRIEWEVAIPEGTKITIKTAVTEDGENPPEPDDVRWQEYEIEQAEGSIPIPSIEPGADLRDKYLWTKQILQSNDPDVTPRLESLTETIKGYKKIEGYRISPEFDISGPEKVKDSRIFWQADERFDGVVSIKVRVSYNGGETWPDWETVEPAVNGARISGLEPETDLSQVKIQTKTSFVGGPDFYPGLENVKIFIELDS